MKKEVGRMECTLMHKNIPVIDVEILTEAGAIVKLGNPQNHEHMPIGSLVKGNVSLKAVNDWWKGRSIPASRDGIKEALRNMGVSSPEHLIEKCYGLSLSDQYWFSPKEMGLKWEDVNFFQNEFSKDVGEILFGKAPKDKRSIKLVSPDNTSDGWLKKKWIISEGKRLLMKGGSNPFQQEPFNEVIASAIMRRLNVFHAEYKVTYEKGYPYSLCENFITEDTELIPAWKVSDVYKKDNKDSVLTHLLRCCERLEIPGVREAIDKMLTVDYIISNEDRHWGNFGFVRDANTLEWKGFSPIFDSGTSLWYDSITIGREKDCEPFRGTHKEQIKLVSDLSWFDYGALDGIEKECKEILAKSKITAGPRWDRIAKAVAARCEKVERMREQNARKKQGLLGEGGKLAAAKTESEHRSGEKGDTVKGKNDTER
jgi:hypothetical protein